MVLFTNTFKKINVSLTKTLTDGKCKLKPHLHVAKAGLQFAVDIRVVADIIENFRNSLSVNWSLMFFYTEL